MQSDYTRINRSNLFHILCSAKEIALLFFDPFEIFRAGLSHLILIFSPGKENCLLFSTPFGLSSCRTYYIYEKCKFIYFINYSLQALRSEATTSKWWTTTSISSYLASSISLLKTIRTISTTKTPSRLISWRSMLIKRTTIKQSKLK